MLDLFHKMPPAPQNTPIAAGIKKPKTELYTRPLMAAFVFSLF
jgi:hypothetical protein